MRKNDRIRIPETEWSKNMWIRIRTMIASIDPNAVSANNAVQSRGLSIAATPNAKRLDITGATLADVYAELTGLNDGETAVCRIAPTAAAILTGNGNSQNGKVNEYVHGVVTRYDGTKYTFFCKSTDGGYIYGWISTLADDTSCATSTVYRYSGTAI